MNRDILHPDYDVLSCDQYAQGRLSKRVLLATRTGSYPQADQGPGDFITPPTWLGPALAWRQQTYPWLLTTVRCFETCNNYCHRDSPEKKSTIMSEHLLLFCQTNMTSFAGNYSFTEEYMLP